MSLMDLQCERFKSAISKAGAETNLVFIISQSVWCSFVEVKSSRYVLLKPLFRILIGQNPAFPRSPSALCLGCCQAGSCLFSVRQRMKLRYMTCYIHTCAFFWEPFHPQLAEFRVPMVFFRYFACRHVDMSMKSSTNIGVRTLDNISPNKVGEIFSP